MNRILSLSALVETATGLALMAVPAVVVHLLIGGEISGPAIPLGRVAGIALFSLGLACWQGQQGGGGRAAFRALLTYNALVALYLAFLGIAKNLEGPLLWPAVVLHAAFFLLMIVASGRVRVGSE